MSDTAQVRRANLAAVRRVLRDGGCHTKQGIAVSTGLSAATCNTLLNELEASGEVVGDKIRRHHVGRSTVAYRLNEDHESVLCLSVDRENGVPVLRTRCVTPLGRVVGEDAFRGGEINEQVLLIAAQDAFARCGNVSCACLGIPGVIGDGEVKDCDIHELVGSRLADEVERVLGVPVRMENDMHLKAYGFFCERCDAGDVATLCYFPSGVLPGTATVHAGTVIRGATRFAGQVGFLPFGLTRGETEAAFSKPQTARPLAARAVAAIITVVNPGKMVFAGDLVDDRMLEEIRRACSETLPEAVMPQMERVESFDGWYLDGMRLRALEEKESRA